MMKSRTALSSESLLEKLSDSFNQVPEYKIPSRMEILLKDFLMPGWLFLLKIPSLLRFKEEMRDKKKFSHLVFGVCRVPSDAQRSNALKGFEIFDNSYHHMHLTGLAG